jgi:hypothetical protein
MLVIAAACSAWTTCANAAVNFSGGAAFGMEHNTNPIELGNTEAHAFRPDGKSELDDTSMVWGANVAGVIGGDGPLRLQLRGLYSHTESRRFDRLGHDDYNVGSTLDWRASRAFDTTLSAEQFRSPIRQAEAGGEQSTQRTTTAVSGTVRVRPTSRWQVAVTPSWSRIDLPLDSAPDFEYRDTSGNVSITYSGARVSPGIMVSESRSRASGIAGATRYRQQSAWGTLNYTTPGRTSLALSVGYTERTTHVIEAVTDPSLQQSEGSDAGLSGSLSLQRKLSAKTSIDISAYRSYQQYEAGVNLSLNTGFNVGVTWTPTRRITVALKSDNMLSDIDEAPGGTALAPTGGKRKDLLRSYSVDVGYLFGKYVSVGGYVTRRIRRSEVWFEQFNSTLAGLRLSVAID